MKNLFGSFMCLCVLIACMFPILVISANRVAATPTSTYIQDCTWASAGVNQPVYKFNVRGSIGGSLGASSKTFTTLGAMSSIADTIIDQSENVTVTGSVRFSYLVNGVLQGYVPATATFVGEVDADGNQSEGIEIVDKNGNVLAGTGRDENDEIILLPVTQGALIISH